MRKNKCLKCIDKNSLDQLTQDNKKNHIIKKYTHTHDNCRTNSSTQLIINSSQYNVVSSSQDERLFNVVNIVYKIIIRLITLIYVEIKDYRQ